MTASQPEAETEYSTTTGASGEPGSAPSGADRAALWPRALTAALGLAGGGLLVGAEFAPLLRVETLAVHPRLVGAVQGGPHHGWSLLVVGALAAALALAGVRARAGRIPGVMLALLGAVALGIAIGVDLPDAHATGLVTTSAPGPTEGEAHAAIGLYLETLGAVLVLLAGLVGSLLGGGGGAPARPEPRPAR